MNYCAKCYKHMSFRELNYRNMVPNLTGFVCYDCYLAHNKIKQQAVLKEKRPGTMSREEFNKKLGIRT